MESWISLLPVHNSRLSEAFYSGNDSIAVDHHRSLSVPPPETSPSPLHFPLAGDADLFDLFNGPSTPAPTHSLVSASGAETGPKHRAAIPAAPISGKVGKRKARASKRAHTTFVAADPANFRQMVQQVTGVRLRDVAGQRLPVSPVPEPEPYRPGNLLQNCLPTLDTSAFLLDRLQLAGAAAAVASWQHHPPPPVPVDTAMPSPPFAPAVVADGRSAAVDFDGLGGFPTLESWQVM